ncbi:hypothetical protein N9L28_05785 [Luminiphilus sp.]|nr:hypothetical protein [Luminiphilus sp.]
MTYLELINGVLTRLREPLAITSKQQEDPVINLAKDFVNDAKRHVEMAHRWNATRKQWVLSTFKGQASYILPSTSDGCIINKVIVDGSHIHQWDLKSIIGHPKAGAPYRYAFDGTDDEGNLSIRFDNIPDKTYTVDVLGWRSLPNLKEDDDVLRIPSQPVLYYALALAARERGEVGGQTAAELFNMAKQYIADAIAIDANHSPTEFMWVAV